MTLHLQHSPRYALRLALGLDHVALAITEAGHHPDATPTPIVLAVSITDVAAPRVE